MSSLYHSRSMNASKQPLLKVNKTLKNCQPFSEFTTTASKLVNRLKVRTNQPQGSEIRPNLRTNQKPWSSYRARGGLC
jgi:hypothetical protein